MAVEVRAMTDAEIHALQATFWGMAPLVGARQRYIGLTARLFGAWVDGTLAGCSGLVFLEHGLAKIENFAVDPSARNHGIGSKLMRALLKDAADLGATRIQAELPGWCSDWRSFYSRFGFTVLDGDTTGMTLAELKLDSPASSA